jgi:hypothetical protein
MSSIEFFRKYAKPSHQEVVDNVRRELEPIAQMITPHGLDLNWDYDNSSWLLEVRTPTGMIDLAFFCEVVPVFTADDKFLPEQRNQYFMGGMSIKLIFDEPAEMMHFGQTHFNYHDVILRNDLDVYPEILGCLKKCLERSRTSVQIKIDHLRNNVRDTMAVHREAIHPSRKKNLKQFAARQARIVVSLEGSLQIIDEIELILK